MLAFNEHWDQPLICNALELLLNKHILNNHADYLFIVCNHATEPNQKPDLFFFVLFFLKVEEEKKEEEEKSVNRLALLRSPRGPCGGECHPGLWSSLPSRSSLKAISASHRIRWPRSRRLIVVMCFSRSFCMRWADVHCH